MKVLVLNSGSSSLKYQLIDSDSEEVLAKGIAERIGLPDGGRIKHQSFDNDKIEKKEDMPDHDAAIDFVFALLADHEHGAVKSIKEISAVGHRVVHGGERFVQPTLVDDSVVCEVERLSDLSPLHNPANARGIRACMRLMPGVPQVAVFDTAFHATMPDYAYTYALPYEYYLQYGLRRYGFHGTSHRYVSDKAIKMLEKLGHEAAKTKIITCHLGNGSSMAAVVGGKVVDTSMGVTPAEGLVMGTRAGDLDPSILPYLAKKLGLSPEELDDLINKKSGFLGLSGVSADMRDVKAAAADGNKRAQLALAIFWYRIRKYVGSYAAAMNGLDALVFTGGIGENSILTRQYVCDNLAVLGIELDHDKNNNLRGPVDLSTPESRVRVLLIPTNEEVVIARETVQVVG